MGKHTLDAAWIGGSMELWRAYRSLDSEFDMGSNSWINLAEQARTSLIDAGYSAPLASAIVVDRLAGSTYDDVQEKAADLAHAMQCGLHDVYAFDAAVRIMRQKGAIEEGALQYAFSLLPQDGKGRRIPSRDAIAGIVAIAVEADPRVIRTIAKYEQPLFSRNVVSLDEAPGGVKVESGFDPNENWGTPYKAELPEFAVASTQERLTQSLLRKEAKREKRLETELYDA